MKPVWKWIISALLLAGLISATALAEAREITDQCKFWVSEGKKTALTDASIRSGWEPRKDGAEMRILLPDDAGYVAVDWLDEPLSYTFTQYDENQNPIREESEMLPDDAGYVAVDWLDEPSSYTFTQYDENQNPIREESEGGSFASICQIFPLEEGARYAGLKLSAQDQAIQRVRVYSKGALTADVKNFLPSHEDCDLLVFSAHQDDEWIFFGGIIPYYEYVQEKKVQLVYMADCGRFRKEEALDGLWAGGVRNYPEFIDLKDERIDSINESLNHWGGKEALTEILVERIRRYKPEVILTHDIDGEYGHNQHKLTSRAMETAIEAAANPALFPASLEKYGAWQVKKLYLHLAKEDVIDFDWNASYAQLDGHTPLEVARIAYDKHKSQHDYFQVNDGGKYDNSLFGLTYSAVGRDAVHNDLFENIAPEPEATPEPTAEPTPVPTAEPTQAPTPVPTVEPTQAPTPEPTAEPTPQPQLVQEKGGGSVWLIGTGAGLAALIGAACIFIRKEQARKRRKKKARRKKKNRL